MQEKGNLAEKPAAEIFRQHALARSSGVVRLASGGQVRVVVFEDGRPVFGISNVPEDQLDVLLVRQKRLTPDQASMAKRQIQKEAELPAKLVELGMLDPATVETVRLDQITRVIQSAMVMRDGEYMIDPSARVVHDLSVHAPIEQWLLDTARSVSAEQARALLGPPEARFVAADVVAIETSPLDSLFLSRVAKPMTIDEINAIGGLDDEDQSLPVIYALYASGLLVRAPDARSADAAFDPAQMSVDEVRQELGRILNTYRLCDFFDVLGLTRQAESSEVKKAYYTLAKQYHPDRFHHQTEEDVQDQLEAIFAVVSRAYETLKEDRSRTEYLRQLGSSATAGTAPPAPPPPMAPDAPRPRPIVPPMPPRSGMPARASAPLSSQTPPLTASVQTGVVSEIDNKMLAEQHFDEAIKRYERKDLVGAIGLFREAVRLAPEKATYHFHLGAALCTNPRWHKEAEKHLLEAARSDPRNIEVYLKLGGIYLEAGLKKRAEAQFRAALGVDPANRIARTGLADMGCDIPALKPAKPAGGRDAGGGLLSRLFKKK